MWWAPHTESALDILDKKMDWMPGTEKCAGHLRREGAVDILDVRVRWTSVTEKLPDLETAKWTVHLRSEGAKDMIDGIR
jgi:hypothetical protein